MKEKTKKLQVIFEVTEPQALALESMFNFWNRLASIGSSRYVAFYVDGDGNFKPKCQIEYLEEKSETNLSQEEINKLSCVKVENDVFYFDFDPLAWKLNEEKKS